MICVSIGRGRHRHMIAEHKFLAEKDVHLVELRLDYIQGTVQVKRLLKDRPCPAIVTCRRAIDGGRWEDSEEARLVLLRMAIVEGADYIDLEDDIATKIPRYGKTKRIISFHDLHRTPPDLTALHKKLTSMDADIVKIATMANHPMDNLRMLELVRGSKIPTVGICMGDIGMPTRILSGKVGSPFTYATFHHDRVLAPGQLGWQQMRDVYRYDTISAATEIYGVVADPVAHSLSPVVHNAALAAAHKDAVYLPFRVPAEQLDEFIASADRWPLTGLSITIPHKEAVLRHVRVQDDMVKAIGAANTLAFTPAGIAAFNTDATAAVESLEAAIVDKDNETHPEGFGVKKALVLGAGGAARAVAFGLKRQGVDVTVASRTMGRTKLMAMEVGCKAVEWNARYRLPYDCLVNATPVGMHPNVDETPFSKEHLRPYMVIFDTVYNPENTLLIKDARTTGCRIVTGVEMFVRQAAIQFKIWQKCEASQSLMRDALKQATASAKQPV
ncbi:MAG: shikimate dehydrogenase [Planctomycetia bacterium]|nr:shikimate dehydrogenase [Planctomycetia bacterium]